MSLLIIPRLPFPVPDALKEILGDRHLLAELRKRLLPEYQDASMEKARSGVIRGLQQEIAVKDEGKNVYDIWVVIQPWKKNQNSITSIRFQQSIKYENAEDDHTYDLAQMFIVYLRTEELVDGGEPSDRLIEILTTIFTQTMSAEEKKKVLLCLL